MLKPSSEAETLAAPVKIRAAAAKTNPKYLIVCFMGFSIFLSVYYQWVEIVIFFNPLVGFLKDSLQLIGD
jgi:hypothetical protein